MGIIRLNELPEGSGSLSNDDIFLFMDDPSGSGVTKKISLSDIGAVIGGGGGNPFDQNLNTTDFPTFSGVNLTNNSSLAEGSFDSGIGGNGGISLNCVVGYELNWQAGHLRNIVTGDNTATPQTIYSDSPIAFPGSGMNYMIVDSSGITFPDGSTINSSPSGSYSPINHNHTAGNITDFNSSVSGLLPVKNIVAGSNISVSSVSGTYTIASAGGSSITVANSGDNRILTSTGSSTGINAESNLTFDGSGLSVNGTAQFNQVFPTVSNVGSVNGTINTNVSLAQIFDITLTGNATLANPTNPVNGVTIRWRITQDNSGNRSVALGNKFVIPSTATNPLPFSTGSGVMDILAATYHEGRDKWDVVAFVPGY